MMEHSHYGRELIQRDEIRSQCMMKRHFLFTRSYKIHKSWTNMSSSRMLWSFPIPQGRHLCGRVVSYGVNVES
jgi:hypothetical protein